MMFIWKHCAECGHEWVAAYLPMSVDKFAAIGKRTICPKCASKKIMCGKKEPNAGNPTDTKTA